MTTPAERNVAAAVAPATITILHRHNHDLRHSYATWLVSAGVPINVVQKVMGHQQASTTLNRYTHPPDDYEERVRAAFGDAAAFCCL